MMIESPPAEPKAGYTFDPYAEPGQLVDIHSPTIPFHNYRQIHVSEVAWFAGITAESIKEIPQCPPKWTDVAHYWGPVALAGWVFYEYGLNSKSSLAIRIVQAGAGAGVIEIIRTFVLPLIGIA